MNDKSDSRGRAQRTRVAFFQRIFARYQAGLMLELARHSAHDYEFYGGLEDPAGTGIEAVPGSVHAAVNFHVCRTATVWHQVTFQWESVRQALFGDYDAYILEGNAKIVTNWIAIPSARLRGKRVILYTHGWLQTPRGFKGWLRNRYYALSNALLLYGDRARSLGVASGFSPSRLYVAYNCIEAERVVACSPEPSPTLMVDLRRGWFGKSYDGAVILGVGRLVAGKEYELLLHAAAHLKSESVTVNILLVGDGPERGALESLAARLGVSLVCAGSEYDEHILRKYFCCSDLTVVPGSAGLTVIHSLSYGTPVIVHDDADAQAPEAEAIQDGVNGAHFKKGDAIDLARVIRGTLTMLPKNDSVRRQCRDVIERSYNPKNMRMIFDNAISDK